MSSSSNKSWIGIAIIFVVVLANLSTAILLSFGADNFSLLSVASFAIFFAVLIISVGRIFLWNWIHRFVDLSRSYALTALFFPLISLVSVFKGESVSFIQWVGIALICLGVSWIALFTKNTSDVR